MRQAAPHLRCAAVTTHLTTLWYADCARVLLMGCGSGRVRLGEVSDVMRAVYVVKVMWAGGAAHACSVA